MAIKLLIKLTALLSLTTQYKAMALPQVTTPVALAKGGVKDWLSPE
jgi:hypothetical protein